MKKQVVVSGIKPTGNLHWGNYLGAMAVWKSYQNQGYDCRFFIADLHAYIDGSGLEPLKQAEVLFNELVSLGIKSENIYLQSHFRTILSNYWMMITKTSLAQLSSLPTIKMQSNPSIGLLSYPILQTADIITLQADIVPVGVDQLPHMRIATNLTKKFTNSHDLASMLDTGIKEFEIDSFSSVTVKSLTDPTSKMSKSIPKGCLYIYDSYLENKVMKAMSTPEGIKNLISLHNAICDKRWEGGKNDTKKLKESLIKGVTKFHMKYPYKEIDKPLLVMAGNYANLGIH